jgi:hypothetical protein
MVVAGPFGYKGIQAFSIYQASSGHVLAAGLAYILVGAAQKEDRLKSDTYKRLNLSLVAYGAVGLSMVGLTSQFRTPMFVLPPLLAFINSIKGYTYGALGWDKKSKSGKIVSDLMEGTKSTLLSMLTIPKNIKALGYLGATLMVETMKIHKLVEIVQLAQAGANRLTIAIMLSRFGRLALFTTVLYTLKDAADRGRLEGTTFIELNLLSSSAFAAMAAHLLPRGSTKLGAAAAFFSVFSAWNGRCSLRSQKVANDIV